MKRAVLKRAPRVPRERPRTGRVLREELLTSWILSRPVPRELLIDVLRVNAKYDRTSAVADAHAAHIRSLRRSPRRRAPTVVAADTKEFHSTDPWSRRVPTVVDELETLVEQVRELHRLADEVMRLSDGVGRSDGGTPP
jgi:hypothetical protein